MFTDIAGFTRLAETLPPTLVARLLRGHFRLLAQCIESERGRIDKIMGDGLIAVWDASGRCRAALHPGLARGASRSGAAVEADNAAEAATRPAADRACASVCMPAR